MLEIPELEVYKNQINEALRFQKIIAVDINCPKVINKELDEFKELVLDELPVFIGLKGKNLVLTLGNGVYLVGRLPSGSRLYLAQANEKIQTKGTVVIYFLNGQRLYFINFRSGSLFAYHKEEMDDLFNNLGIEALDKDLTLENLTGILSENKGTLKHFFTEQQSIAGIGQCYSDEILFNAAIRPDRKADDLKMSEMSSLHSAISYTLKDAIINGGCLTKPFRKGDQLTGGYHSLIKVYNREGENCYLCSDKIKTISIDGQKSYFCPTCQR